MPLSRQLRFQVRRTATIIAAAVIMAGGGIANTAHADPSYTISVGATGSFSYPTDTPASPYLDRDGTFWFQESASLYGANDPHEWDFFSGTDLDHAAENPISGAVDPANPQDANNDTVWRCNSASPTGAEATPASGTGYAYANYCDLVGTWLDPDTGDWIGLVHNEFTPVPFPGVLGFQHFDSIDYAVSTDKGKTWKITGHAITSPYSTQRNDTAAFPNQTWDYGDGDPRLFVDYRSGYFYVTYGSRIQNKSGPAQTVSLSHVARAPIAGKMASGTWSKWYDGHWSQPGIGGQESNLTGVSADNPNGYTPIAADYNPANIGTVSDQVAAGTLPDNSDLFTLNITYDAYLGLYIGEPSKSGNTTAGLPIYATKDLGSQKWQLIGDTGSYNGKGWYRWIVDTNLTNPDIVGKTYRSYCSIACTSSDGEYVDLTINGPAAQPVTSGASYKIINADGRQLTVKGTAVTSAAPPARSHWWRFQATGEGSYVIIDQASGRALGVDSTSATGRAWGAEPGLTEITSDAPSVGQQWFVIDSPEGTRLINRYSGLALSLSAVHDRQADTTPLRTWNGAGRTPADQLLSLVKHG